MRRSLPSICAAFCLAASPAVAFADSVTPSERVTTRLRIREAPEATSATIGNLEPGQSLPLKASIPSWYELQLPDGSSGFVSKAWARLIPDVAVADGPELRVGSWNIRKLGHGTNKDFSALANVIEANFDILAVVEIMQAQQAHPGYDALVAQLGNGWTSIVTSSPRPNTTSGNSEFYAIFYRRNRATLCNGWPGMVYYADPAEEFSRPPAFACFIATRPDGTRGFDFMLAAYHARWADGDTIEIQVEAAHLGDVFAAMAATGERDLILAGDFNLRPLDLQSATGLSVSTVGPGSTLNTSGDVTANLYDHILVRDLAHTPEQLAPGTILDVRPAAASKGVFFRTVSDHLPIVARFRVAPDDD